MKTTYEARGVIRLAEQDSFERGCIGGSEESYINYHFIADTLPALINKVASFVGCNPKNAEYDACEVVGRVDFSRKENDAGEEPTSAEWAAFRKGDLLLWYVTYKVYVEKVTREPVSTAPSE